MSCKKMISAVLAAVTAAALMAGCGEKKSENVSVSVGGWPAKEGQALDDKNAQKAAFEEKNPGIEIVPDTWTFDLSTFYPKAAAGTLPNLFYTYYTEMDKIISAAYSADITDKLAEEGFDKLMNPVLLDMVSDGGRIYGYPFTCHAQGLAYNVSLFEKAGLMNADGTPMQPQTWEDVKDFAIKIKEATGVPGFMLPTSNKNGGWIFCSVAWSFGAEFVKEDKDGKWKSNIDCDEVAEALEFIRDLKWKYNVMPENTLIDLDEYYKQFSTGQAGIIVAGDDIASKTIKYEMDNNDLGMLPPVAGPKKRVSMLNGSTYCLSENSTPEQISAAVDWLKFTGVSPSMNDEEKTNREAVYKQYRDEGRLIGIRALSPWTDSSEYGKNEEELRKKYLNADENHFKAFNDYVENAEGSGVEMKLEEKKCCQDLYAILDNVIQEILNNENADIRQIIKDADNDFQVNYLDNVQD